MPTPKNRLEYLRKSHFLSQREVAEKLGISQQSYGKIESGRCRLTVETASKLKGIYKLDSIDALINEAV